MDIELIDKAWACLPKEFKEEVKEIFRKCLGVPKYEAITIKPMLLGYLFGHHNLTSDAEGEEMLMCEKSKIQKVYNTSREIVKAENPDSLMYSMHTQIMCVLENIFGSKCLPDAHEDNFTTKEPQPAEPKNDGTSQKQYAPKNAESGTHLDSIANNGFEHNRLHIAAMIAQGIMANSNPQMVDTNVERIVDLAIVTADTLIAECKKKGGSDGED